MRVLRLAQSWTTMRVLLSIILSSLGALANLTFVLAIVVYIFAVIGMQLFGRDYTPENFYPDPVPRWNFKDFFHSFMMIFRILCGEWAEPLWDCMRAERNSVSSQTPNSVCLPSTFPYNPSLHSGLGDLLLHLPAGPRHGQLLGTQSLLGFAAQQFQLRGTQIAKGGKNFFFFFCPCWPVEQSCVCCPGNRRGFQIGRRFEKDPHHRQSDQDTRQFEFVRKERKCRQQKGQRRRSRRQSGGRSNRIRRSCRPRPGQQVAELQCHPISSGRSRFAFHIRQPGSWC